VCLRNELHANSHKDGAKTEAEASQVLLPGKGLSSEDVSSELHNTELDNNLKNKHKEERKVVEELIEDIKVFPANLS
jgi:imidazoleglycerol phosphate synthase glutamine amidotransferase subunit HisH